MERHLINTTTVVQITQEEWDELSKAFIKLYETLDRFPTFLGDYCKDREEYLNIEKWKCLLRGEPFSLEDYE